MGRSLLSVPKVASEVSRDAPAPPVELTRINLKASSECTRTVVAARTAPRAPLLLPASEGAYARKKIKLAPPLQPPAAQVYYVISLRSKRQCHSNTTSEHNAPHSESPAYQLDRLASTGAYFCFLTLRDPDSGNPEAAKKSPSDGGFLHNNCLWHRRYLR